jgi:hypothetical protein
MVAVQGGVAIVARFQVIRAVLAAVVVLELSSHRVVVFLLVLVEAEALTALQG